MTKPTLAQALAHLNLDAGPDDQLVEAKVDAANAFLQALAPDAPAPVLHEATLRLVGHFYEAREGVGFDLDTIPAGILALVAPFRAVAF